MALGYSVANDALGTPGSSHCISALPVQAGFWAGGPNFCLLTRGICMDITKEPKTMGEEAPKGVSDPQNPMPQIEVMSICDPSTQTGQVTTNVPRDTILGQNGSDPSGPSNPTYGGKRKNRCGSAKKRARKAKAEQALQLAASTSDAASANIANTSLLGGPQVGSNSGEGGAGDSGGPVASAPKRQRDEDATPPEIRKVVKMNNGGALSMTFSEAVQSDKRLAIVPVGYPGRSLTYEEGSLISRALLAAMDAIPKGMAVPRFEGTRWLRGALWVTCADDQAKEWLNNVVPSLRPWENAALTLLDKGKIPRLKKMMAVFPDTNEEVGAIFRRLVRCNPGLQTEMWKVWRAKPVGRNLQLILGVDEGSVAELTKLSFAPYFGLGRARFQDLQSKTERGDVGPKGGFCYQVP
ncbi:hypothetical protein PV327_011170 [Microctonus hyperodae]|uniref:DUF4780 domain-containing protein n=1 Tax=Microctonus hyperodae TaxID=165561 RepID=A0AA39EWJ4_MICHY|nr:hypothetical protein PV327_011170 [Microctonus hyperodae]